MATTSTGNSVRSARPRKRHGFLPRCQHGGIYLCVCEFVVDQIEEAVYGGFACFIFGAQTWLLSMPVMSKSTIRVTFLLF